MQNAVCGHVHTLESARLSGAGTFVVLIAGDSTFFSHEASDNGVAHCEGDNNLSKRCSA